MLSTLIVSMRVADYKQKWGLVLKPRVGTPSPMVKEWWDELLTALGHRRDIGLPIRTLRIVGGWTTEKLRRKTAKLDGRMLARAAELVSEIVDERRVDPSLLMSPYQP